MAPNEIAGVTTSLVDPLKFKAELIFPAVQTAPLMAPLYPLPEVSWAMLPEFSSKFQIVTDQGPRWEAAVDAGVTHYYWN